MSNDRRDPEKVLVSCYIKRQLRDDMRVVLDKAGISFTDFIVINILKLLNGGADETIKEIMEQFKEQDGRRAESKRKKNSKDE